MVERVGSQVGVTGEIDAAPVEPLPSTAEVRAWARLSGLDVPLRGSLRPETWHAWSAVHGPEEGC